MNRLSRQHCAAVCALTSCKKGECFRVQSVHGEGAGRLRDVGVCEGAVVNMLKNRGDVIVRVAGCRVGLREEVACKVYGVSVLSPNGSQGS